jgi:hypothetical protein
MKPKKSAPRVLKVYPPGSLQAAAQALGLQSKGKKRELSFEERRRRAEWMRGVSERMWAERRKNNAVRVK